MASIVVYGIVRDERDTLVFCPRHGFGATVYGVPSTQYTGGETPWHKVIRGEDCRCNANGCSRRLVVGTMEAALECGKRGK